jgi:hypothetical protein
MGGWIHVLSCSEYLTAFLFSAVAFFLIAFLCSADNSAGLGTSEVWLSCW